MTRWKCQSCGATMNRPRGEPRRCSRCKRRSRFTVEYDNPDISFFRTHLYHVLPAGNTTKAYCGAKRIDEPITKEPQRASNTCANCWWYAKAKLPKGTLLHRPEPK